MRNATIRARAVLRAGPRITRKSRMRTTSRSTGRGPRGCSGEREMKVEIIKIWVDDGTKGQRYPAQ